MRRRQTRDETTCDTGASAVEYSLVVVAVAGILVLLVFALGGYATGDYKQTCDNLSAAKMSSATGSDCG